MTAQASTPRQIGERTFDADDQRRFARMSGDVNPMHMDPVAARRLITGRQVVHGVHILLTALESWRGYDASPVRAIACSFNNPVSVGEAVVFTQTDTPGQPSTIEASVNGLLCAMVTLTGAAPGPVVLSAGATAAGEVTVLEPTTSALEQQPESHLGKQYALPLRDFDFATAFPRAAAGLGARHLAAMAGLSYIVGMVCPGLHSVFSSLDVAWSDRADAEADLRFSVAKYDPRFRLFDIAIGGAVQGKVRAFQRPPPEPQPSMQALAKSVTPQEFAGTRSLVIGGSRGLGELTAKLLAAGGGEVTISYAAGKADAEAIVADVNATAQQPLCSSVQLDLTADDFGTVAIDWKALDAIYFFATPRIFRKKLGVFDAALFREFCDFYIERFHALCVFLESHRTEGKVKLYFPSTVFVEERPKGMAEYAMAKAAAEVLIQDINRSFAKVNVVCSRLPRLNTDQTSSIMKLATGSNVDTLLPLIRSMAT